MREKNQVTCLIIADKLHWHFGNIILQQFLRLYLLNQQEHTMALPINIICCFMQCCQIEAAFHPRTLHETHHLSLQPHCLQVLHNHLTLALLCQPLPNLFNESSSDIS